jgi:hypothetical protein
MREFYEHSVVKKPIYYSSTNEQFWQARMKNDQKFLFFEKCLKNTSTK